MQYSPHGCSKIRIENNVLILELAGSFNKEGVKLVHNNVQSLISEQSPSKWSLIIFLERHTLLTMEAIEDTRYFFLWSQKHGCEKVAYVAISSIQIDATNLIFNNINIEKGFFKNIEDAKKWI